MGCWPTGRRTCRADKYLTKRRRGDGEAEERSTSLLFLRGVSDGASQGRSAFRPARRPSRHMCGNLRGRAEKIPGGTIVPITKTPDPPIIMMNLVLCKNWHNAALLPNSSPVLSSPVQHNALRNSQARVESGAKKLPQSASISC